MKEPSTKEGWPGASSGPSPRGFALGTLAALVIGCSPAPSEQRPDRLHNTTIAPDFGFETQRAVSVSLEGELDLSNILVELSTPAGELLYRGPMAGKEPLRVPLSTWIPHLVAKLSGPGLERAVEAEVAEGRAVIRL